MGFIPKSGHEITGGCGVVNFKYKKSIKSNRKIKIQAELKQLRKELRKMKYEYLI